MGRRVLRFAVVAAVPTAVDLGLLVLLVRGAGWNLVAANLTSIAVASLLSWTLHRLVDLRSNPFVRWVRMPVAFVVVAALAGALDTAVLSALVPDAEAVAAAELVAAKALAVLAASWVRVLLYRTVLLTTVRRSLQQRLDRPPAPGVRRASVILPALDEAARIGAAVRAVRAVPQPGEPIEVVVVDDGSSDGTADVALAAGADQVVVLPANRGKGAAVRAGVAAARGRTLTFTDADLAYDPAQLAGVIEPVESGWDVVIGNRRLPGSTTVRGAGHLRSAGSRAINLLAAAILLSRPHDTQCGLKAFRADVGKGIFSLGRVDGFAFDIELLHLAERYELSLLEIPVRLDVTPGSSVRALRDGLRLVRDLLRIRHWSSTGVYEV